MAVLVQFMRGSRALVRRFGLEVAISMVALVVVAYGVSRALPSADPSRFDRVDPAWVGQLSQADEDAAAVAAPPPTSASLTIPPAAIASATPADANPTQIAKLTKLAVVPPRRPRAAEGATPPEPPIAAMATPVAATPADFLGLSRVTSHLPSREALLRPLDAVGSTVVNLFKRP